MHAPVLAGALVLILVGCGGGGAPADPPSAVQLTSSDDFSTCLVGTAAEVSVTQIASDCETATSAALEIPVADGSVLSSRLDADGKLPQIAAFKFAATGASYLVAVESAGGGVPTLSQEGSTITPVVAEYDIGTEARAYVWEVPSTVASNFDLVTSIGSSIVSITESEFVGVSTFEALSADGTATF